MLLIPATLENWKARVKKLDEAIEGDHTEFTDEWIGVRAALNDCIRDLEIIWRLQVQFSNADITVNERKTERNNNEVASQG